MSGEVELLDDANHSISRLLTTARDLFSSEGFRPAALIGGLAVTCRIGSVHRATTDVDTVTDGEGPREHVIEYLADGTETERVLVNGVMVDALTTFPLPPSAGELPDDSHQRLFVLGHRWALDTAEPITVRATRPDGSTVTADLTVATTAALLACKLHAIAGRPSASADKKESDARDIYRLTRELAQAEATAFGDAPFDLTALVGDSVARWLVDDATRTARLINFNAGSGEPIIDRQDLLAAGQVLLGRLH